MPPKDRQGEFLSLGRIAGAAASADVKPVAPAQPADETDRRAEEARVEAELVLQPPPAAPEAQSPFSRILETGLKLASRSEEERTAREKPPKDVVGKRDFVAMLAFDQDALEAVAKVREFGIRKYPGVTHKRVPRTQYLAAALRHMQCEYENPGSIDSESGLTHLAHATCSLMLALQTTDRS